MKLIKTETIELSHNEADHFEFILSMLQRVSETASNPDNQETAKRTIRAISDFLSLVQIEDVFIETDYYDDEEESFPFTVDMMKNNP